MCYPSDGIRQQFTAKERDNETGLDFFEARYFASNQGRFILTDPLMNSAHVGVPQSWNRYPYALNNHLRFIDPNGLEAEDPQSEAQAKVEQEKQKPTPGQDPNPPQGPLDKVTINANGAQILNFGDKRVPVGGEFEITYSYAKQSVINSRLSVIESRRGGAGRG